MFVNEVVDEFPCVVVQKSGLVYSGPLEELLEIGVNIFEIESMVRIPAYMADVLEVGRHSNVVLCQFLLVPLLTPHIFFNL